MKKKEVESLLTKLHTIETEKLIKGLKNIGKSEKKELLTKLSIISLPIIIFGTMSLITQNPIHLVGIAYGMGLIAIVNATKEFINEIKEMKRIYKNPGMFSTTTTSKPKKQKRKSVTEIEKEYYTKEYSKMIEESNKTNNNTKEKITPTIELEIDEENLNETGDILTTLKKELDTYYIMYELPPFIINDDELEIIINEFKKIYQNKEEKIYDVITDIIKTTFANIMIDPKEAIGFTELYESFEYLKYLGLSKQEIKILEYQIKKEIKKYKEEKFNSYIKKR